MPHLRSAGIGICHSGGWASVCWSSNPDDSFMASLARPHPAWSSSTVCLPAPRQMSFQHMPSIHVAYFWHCTVLKLEGIGKRSVSVWNSRESQSPNLFNISPWPNLKDTIISSFLFSHSPFGHGPHSIKCARCQMGILTLDSAEELSGCGSTGDMGVATLASWVWQSSMTCGSNGVNLF